MIGPVGVWRIDVAGAVIGGLGRLVMVVTSIVAPVVVGMGIVVAGSLVVVGALTVTLLRG